MPAPSDARPLPGFVHVDGWTPGRSLAAAIDETVRCAEFARVGRPLPRDPGAAAAAGADALEAARQVPVSDIRDDAALSAAFVLHRAGLPGSLHDPDVVAARRMVDDLLRPELCRIVEAEVTLRSSGHFWYPPDTGMGWHTNQARPGYRAYVTRTDVAGRSWFRFADPSTGRVVTSTDSRWDLRLFHIDEQLPFWHAVWSGCHRHSFGYHLTIDP